MKLGFFNLCQQHNITPRGIISIGGCDRKTFKRLNLPDPVKTLLLDVNAKAVGLLQANLAESPNLQVVHAAISNHLFPILASIADKTICGNFLKLVWTFGWKRSQG